MNKKRIFALILSICLIFNVLPFSAFTASGEEATTVVNGKYNNSGVWGVGGDGTLSYDDGYLTLSKTAKATSNPNEFDITLKVQSKVTENFVKAANATALVFDVSSSMSSNIGGESKIGLAKEAALNFLARYKNLYTTSATPCYVCVITFGKDGYLKKDWVDVSKKTGYDTIVSTINGIKALSEGTNMDAGLKMATEQFGSDTIKAVDSKYRFTILLSDGQPTYAIGDSNKRIGTGSSCSQEIAERTAARADTLKKKCSLFTVYIGSNYNGYLYTYRKDDFHWYNFGDRHFHTFGKTVYGPTMGEFLEDYIATKATNTVTYAYKATSKQELTTAYNTIFGAFNFLENKGTSSAGLTVVDPMGKGIIYLYDYSIVDGMIPQGNNTYAWVLNPLFADVKTVGATTTFTYSLTYRIKLDAEMDGFDENKYYPANGRTYLIQSFTERKEFPVPGIKGQALTYTVTFNEGSHGDITGADANGNKIYSKVKRGTGLPEAPEVKADSDYYFAGWAINGNIVDLSKITVNSDITLVAQYAKKSEITLVGDSDEVFYTASEQKITDFEKQGLPKGATLTGVSYKASGFDAGEYTGKFTYDNAKITLDGKDVTYMYKFKEQVGKLTINPRALLVTSVSKQKTYDGNPFAKADYEDNTVIGLQGNDKLDSVKYKEQTQSDAGVYENVVSDAVVKNANKESVNKNYDIKYGYGKLTINKVPNVVVTISGKYSEEVYDGSEKSVSGYDISVKQPEGTIAYAKSNITFSGTDADKTAKGTTSGDYKTPLDKSKFSNTNDNYDVTIVIDKDVELLIKASEEEIVVTAKSDNKVYDGKPLTNSGFDYTGKLPTGYTVEATVSGTITDVGEVENKVTSVKILNATKEDVTSQFANITKMSGKLTVTKRAVTITSPSASKFYDGTPLQSADKDFKIEGFVSGEGVTIKNKKSVTDVTENLGVDNTFEWTFNSNTKAGNYTVTPVYGRLIVKEVSGLVVTIIGKSIDTITYDGKPHEVTGYDVSVDKEKYKDLIKIEFVPTEDCKVAKASGTDAGTYNMGLTKANFKNTNTNLKDVTIVVIDGALTIKPVYNVEVNIVGNKDEVYYNGKTQKVEGYTPTIAKDDSKLFKLSYVSFNGTAIASGMVKGDYPMNLDASQFGSNNTNFENIIFHVTDGGLKINPIGEDKKITVTAKGGEKKYDGTPLNATVDFNQKELLLQNGDVLTALAIGTITDAGSTSSYIYDGSVKIVHDPNGANIDVTDCYTFTTEGGTLKINKREVTLTSGSTKREYNGLPLTNSDVTITGDGFVDGEGVNTLTTAQILNKGKTKNTFSYSFKAGTKEGNYAITKVEGDLEITAVQAQVTVKVAGDKKTFTYDGNAKKAEGYTVTNISNTLYTEDCIDFSGTAKVEKTNAGTYPMGLKEADFANNSDNFANVKFVVTDGELKISKANATSLDAVGYEGTYDAKNHDAITGAEVKGDVKGTKWTYKYKDSKGVITDTIPQVKDAGEYEYTVIASNENYEDIETKVTVKISPATIKVKAEDKEQIIGEEKAELTYTYENPIKGEGPVFSGKLSTDAKDERGKYDIKQGDLALKDGEGFKASNYKIEYTPATYKVLLKDFTLDVDVDKTVAKVGDTITYTITVKNTGDVDYKNLTVKSDLLGITELIKSLKVGEVWSKQFTYVVKPEDAGKDLVNTVTAYDEDNNELAVKKSTATTIEIPVSPKTSDTTNPFTMLIPMLVCASYISMYSRKKRQSK